VAVLPTEHASCAQGRVPKVVYKGIYTPNCHAFYLKGTGQQAQQTAKYIHCEAEKRPFSFGCIFLILHKNGDFFLPLRKSYNSVYLTLACVKNF